MKKTKFYCSEVIIYVEEVFCFFYNNEEVKSKAMTIKEERMNTRLGYYLPAEDANTQTTNEDLVLLETTQDVSTQTTEEDFMFLEKTREVSTQTADEDLVLLEPTREAGTQTTDGDFILLENTQDAGAWTTEEFILLEPTRKAKFKTANEDSVLLEPTSDSSKRSTKADFILPEKSPCTSTQSTDKDFILFEPTRYKRTLSSMEYFSTTKASDINNIPKNSADSRETISITWIRYNNSCCIGNVNLADFSSRREVSSIPNAPRKHPVPNHMQIENKFPGHNRTRNLTNYQKITLNVPVVKRSRYTKCAPVLSRKNTLGDVRYVCSKSNEMIFDSNSLVVNNQNPRNSVQKNLDLKTVGNLGRNRLLAVSHFEKDALHKNQIYQNKYTPSKISDSKQCIDSAIVTFKVKDLSCSYENKKRSNQREKKFQPEFPLEVKSVSSERKKQSVCWKCNTVHNEHDFGKDFYKCFVCRYTSNRKRDLQQHAYIDRHEHFCCKTCEEEFTGKDSLNTEQTCSLCFEVFQCQGVFKKHLLVHEDYNLSHCRVCKWKISAHIIEYRGRRQYHCCGCSYRTKHTKYLHQHLNTHVGLKVFRCYVCESSFSEKKSLERHFRNTHNRSYE